jgi:MFS family permease
MDLVALFGTLGMLVTLPIPFLGVSHVELFYALIWLLFFFGSIILAPLVGLMLNQVKAHRRTTANSLATLFFNLFGYLPSPFIFGFFADKWPEDEDYSMRLALGVTVYWSIASVVFMVLAYILNLKRLVKNKGAREILSDDEATKPVGDSGGSGL